MRNTLLACATLFLLGAASAGCGADAKPKSDAGTTADAGADAGCVPGELGCACDAGACADGVCTLDVCVACPLGSEGCGCRSSGSCDTGFRCGDPSGLCETCPPGELSCPCATGDVCGSGLLCTGAVCVADTCVAGALDCPCRVDVPACDLGGTCESGLCRTCTSDVIGCPCDAGACTGGLVCEADACRAAATCDDLVRADLCAPYQVCTEGTAADASCTPATCVAGYRWAASTASCVACISADCSAEPTCVAGFPTSLDCAAEHRDCVQTDGVGACGVCVAGFHDADGVCVSNLVCGATFCTGTQYCDTTNPAGPTCTAWPCPSRNQVIGTTGTCSVTCTRSCALTGALGSYWPYADEGDNCVCETLAGFYFDNGASVSAPVACDADGDGWVRTEVRAIRAHTPVDRAIVANERCEVRSAGAVELTDEYGNTSLVDSCEEGLLQDRAPGTPCTPLPLRLFETKRNDVEGWAASLGVAPAYAAGGRRFRASELNSLTKACASALGDYDDDGHEDLSQTQPNPVDTAPLGEVSRLSSFAHFVELYRTGWRAPVAPGGLGTLMIAERSRCEAAFPLGYGDAAPYEPSTRTGTAYWRNCERDRGPGYDAGALVPLPGYDFGQYTCADRAGRCGVDPIGALTNDVSGTSSLGTPPAPVPANPTYDGMPPLTIGTAPDGSRIIASGTLMRDHGLCELGGTRPAGGVFRGMNHHSQFQCVQVVADGAMAPTAYQRRRSLFGGTSLTTTGSAGAPSSATLTFNSCQVQDCAGLPGCVDSVPPTTGGGLDPADPVLGCAVSPLPALPSEAAVGWAAVRYQTYGERASDGNTPLGDATYNGGCVNEVAEWPNLCPAAVFGTCNAGASDAFGRFCCYGCDTGCPRGHAGGRCTADASGVGSCDIGSCDVGWGNCDRIDATGCEDPLNSLTSCGGCAGYSDREARTPAAGAFPTCARANVGESCAEDLSVEGTERCRTAGSCDAGFGNCNLTSMTALARQNDTDGCENTLDSLSSCGACGAACSLPNGTETCGGDICRSLACDSTYYDLNLSTGLMADGCECRDEFTNANTTCATAQSMLVSTVGTTVTKTGKIPIGSTTAYDWYAVSFAPSGRRAGTPGVTPGTAGAGWPSISLAGAAFRFEAFVGTCASPVDTPCNYVGDTRSSLSSWNFNDGNDSGAGDRGYQTNDVAWPDTVYVRVHRVSATATCDSYTLTAGR